MKKKTIIICTIAATIMAGASVVAAYTLDGISTIAHDAPIEEQLAAVEKAGTIIKEVVDNNGDKYYTTMTKEEVAAEAKRVKTKDILARVTAKNEHFGEEYATSLKEVDGFGEDMIRDCYDMNETQIKEYVERLGSTKRRGGILGSYPRICNETLGIQSASTPRLTVEALDALVSQSHSAVEFCNNISSQYGSPDFCCQFSGREGLRKQYWLDDEGTEWIELVVVPNNDDWVVERISLQNYDDFLNGDRSGKKLYSKKDLKAIFSTAE